jgi:hypothetical protein
VVQVVATEFAFDPAAMTAQASEEISITLSNAGNAPNTTNTENA